MKLKGVKMDCKKVIDSMYDNEDGGFGDFTAPSFLESLKIEVHLLFCPACREKLRRLNLCKKILREDFLPESPGLEDAIMSTIAVEDLADTQAAVPEGFSFRGWTIAGLVLLVSMATIFFGMDFNRVALASGTSFIIAIGITMGLALSIYGALFIASHLERLSRRFGLESPEAENLPALNSGPEVKG